MRDGAGPERISSPITPFLSLTRCRTAGIPHEGMAGGGEVRGKAARIISNSSPLSAGF